MRLLKLRAYLKAAHFGPTMLITAISFVLATTLWWEGPAYVIAFTVFLGQLIIGWSNDLYDYADDLSHQRLNKPLVEGSISREFLTRCLFIMVPLAFLANLIAIGVSKYQFDAGLYIVAIPLFILAVVTVVSVLRAIPDRLPTS